MKAHGRTLIRRLFSGTPANVYAIGMAITTVALVTAVLSVGLYVSMAGGTVNIPAGLYSFSASRIYDGPSYGMEERPSKYHPDDGGMRCESDMGPSSYSVIPFEYPFLPVMAEIYKCITPPSSPTPN